MLQHIAKAITTVHTQLEPQTPASTEKSSDGSQPWDDIELSEEDVKRILGQAKFDIWDERQKAMKAQRSQEIQQWITAPWTPTDLMNHVKYRAKEVLKLKYKTDTGEQKIGLKVTDHNRKILTLLSYYFSRDEAKFRAYGKEHFVDPEDPNNDYGNDFDINKGICLWGPVGPGKTTTMRLFAQNKRQCYNVVSCRTVVDKFIEHGVSVIEQFSKKKPEAFMDPNVFFQKHTGWMFDDFGTEMSQSANYANRKPVMEEILQNLYDQYSTGQLNLDSVHMTTNLKPSEIGRIYGERVKSRCREMFNIVVFNGPDMRA